MPNDFEISGGDKIILGDYFELLEKYSINEDTARRILPVGFDESDTDSVLEFVSSCTARQAHQAMFEVSYQFDHYFDMAAIVLARPDCDHATAINSMLKECTWQNLSDPNDTFCEPEWLETFLIMRRRAWGSGFTGPQFPLHDDYLTDREELIDLYCKDPDHPRSLPANFFPVTPEFLNYRAGITVARIKCAVQDIG